MTQPKTTTMYSITGKVAYNYKLVQVSGHDEAAICCYDKEGNRTWSTSSIKKATKLPDGSGSSVVTESGSVYFLLHKEEHNSSWKIGLQIKRPGVFDRLQKAGVL